MTRDNFQKEMTVEDILKTFGSKKPFLKKPFWRNDGSGEHYEPLTKSGIKSFEKLRELLIDLDQKNVIKFNEDKLDEFVFGVCLGE